jgi:hypothetical protein
VIHVDQQEDQQEPDIRECVRDAVASLTGRPALNAIKSGTRSEVLLTELEPARDSIVRQVCADLGADVDALPATQARLVGAFSEVTLLRESIFLRMAGQPATNKGRARALLSAYVSLIDRELRLAQAIGLERRAKPVPTLEQYISSRKREDGNE